MANDLVKIKEATIDALITKMDQLQENGEIVFPKNYSVENALKSAWLKLQTVETKIKGNKVPVLVGCTKTSIYNALYDMAIQGLTSAKSQCYFIPYQDQLTLQVSYFGKVAVAKRFSEVKNVVAHCIYEDDVFDYEFDLETGMKKVLKHEQDFRNVDIRKIVGAYAIVIVENGPNYLEIMNMNQIKSAWNQGKFKGYEVTDANGNIKPNTTHYKFTDQMAKKAVISRATKMYINTSDDSILFAESIQRTDENELIEAPKPKDEIKQEIKEKANKKPLKFEDDEEIEDIEIELTDKEKEEIIEAEKVETDGPLY